MRETNIMYKAVLTIKEWLGPENSEYHATIYDTLIKKAAYYNIARSIRLLKLDPTMNSKRDSISTTSFMIFGFLIILICAIHIVIVTRT